MKEKQLLKELRKSKRMAVIKNTTGRAKEYFCEIKSCNRKIINRSLNAKYCLSCSERIKEIRDQRSILKFRIKQLDKQIERILR